MPAAILPAPRRIFDDGCDAHGTAAADLRVFVPFLASNSQKRAGAAHDRIVLGSSGWPGRCGTYTTIQPVDHDCSDGGNAVGLENIVCFIAQRVSADIRDRPHTWVGFGLMQTATPRPT